MRLHVGLNVTVGGHLILLSCCGVHPYQPDAGEERSAAPILDPGGLSRPGLP
jgi:hypothetical protein